MSSSVVIDKHDDMVVLRFEGTGVPILFHVDEHGFAEVFASRLSSRFHLMLSSIHVDEEVFDLESQTLLYTLSLVPDRNSEIRKWILKPGRYVVYGLVETVQNQCTENLVRMASTPSVSITPKTTVKLEPGLEPITILSDDSDDNICLPTDNPSTVTSSVFVHDERPGSQKCDGGPGNVLSILPILKMLGEGKGRKSSLFKIDFATIEVHRVKHLPPIFNGDVIFELPPVTGASSRIQGGSLSGMDTHSDGHVWRKSHTTNIRNNVGLKFRVSNCLGHLRCENAECGYLKRVHRTSSVNETEWEGQCFQSLRLGEALPADSTLVCKICQSPPMCVATCPATVHYVVGAANTSRAFIHSGLHKHPVKRGEDRVLKERSSQLLVEQLQRTPNATHSSVVLEATKEFISDFLLDKDDSIPTSLSYDDLLPVLDKCKYLSTPNIRNEVASFKNLRKFGVLDSITRLRGISKWAFVQENKFPGQGAEKEKVFLFKMSEVGPGSGVDLVTRMQPGGDLQDAWIMFDHVKRVAEWTTMACHVYDSGYCRVMTIAVCDMQSEDTSAQVLFWKNLNSVMCRNGVPLPEFKGFMADSAQANWNAVRIVYGGGDAKIVMMDKERTCLFHWTQSLEKHTKADIRPDLQDQHKHLCKQYKDASSMEDAEARYLAIRSWWKSSGAATDASCRRLELWLAFWHFRYRQWGGFMQLNMSDEERAEMPSCNLAESVHNKWLQQSGNRGTDLYVASVDDYVRAWMQLVRYYQYLKGDSAGTGPDKEELLLRSAHKSVQKFGNPRALNDAMRNMEGCADFCNREARYEGAEIFGTLKRKADLPIGSEFESHRPDKQNYSRPRVNTRSNSALLGSGFVQPMNEENGTPVISMLSSETPASMSTHVTAVLESDCDERNWHIARLHRDSSKACFAQHAKTRKKCTAKIVQNAKSTAAPTYTGDMNIPRKNKIDRDMQFFFCNDDIERCVKGLRRRWVLGRPELPEIWPVKRGTKLTEGEILRLESAGFRLPQRPVLSPRRLFGSSSLEMPREPPSDADVFPTSRSGKAIRRNMKAPTDKHLNNCASALSMIASVAKITRVPHPGFGCVFAMDSGISPSISRYHVTIGSYPECTCPFFKDMVISALGKRPAWVNCKHLYYIYTIVCGFSSTADIFVHAPSLSFNEVAKVMAVAIIEN